MLLCRGIWNYLHAVAKVGLFCREENILQEFEKWGLEEFFGISGRNDRVVEKLA
jgi:hypothetical protein